MTRFRSRFALVLLPLAVAGCVSSSGDPATGIAQPAIASAYVPLHSSSLMGLDTLDGAAVVIAPGIAATNAHNANLVARDAVIGTVQDYDLLFFRSPHGTPPETAPVVIGGAVTAYGQGESKSLRVAHGVVREIHMCPGCTVPAYFTFAGNAGPGFSGGPVLDASGRLVGITFGYKDNRSERLIYAYGMDRVRLELSGVQKRSN